MNQLNSQDYYAARAASSRELERRAANATIAAVHADMAARYEQLAAPHQNRGSVVAILQRSA